MNDIVLEIQHASMRAFDTPGQMKSDLEIILNRNVPVNAFTEMGVQESMKTLMNANHSTMNRFNVFNPDGGDIAFALHKHIKVLDVGGRFAVNKVSGHGGHGPRFVSHVTFEWEGVIVTHHAVHFVTGWDENPQRRAQVLHHAALMGEEMKKHGQGGRISTGSGDINAVLSNATPIRNVFDNHGIESIAHDLDFKKGTHGDRMIDYIFTYAGDGRVSAKDVQVMRRPATKTDHDQVIGKIAIRR